MKQCKFIFSKNYSLKNVKRENNSQTIRDFKLEYLLMYIFAWMRTTVTEEITSFKKNTII